MVELLVCIIIVAKTAFFAGMIMAHMRFFSATYSQRINFLSRHFVAAVLCIFTVAAGTELNLLLFDNIFAFYMLDIVFFVVINLLTAYCFCLLGLNFIALFTCMLIPKQHAKYIRDSNIITIYDTCMTVEKFDYVTKKIDWHKLLHHLYNQIETSDRKQLDIKAINKQLPDGIVCIKSTRDSITLSASGPTLLNRFSYRDGLFGKITDSIKIEVKKNQKHGFIADAPPVLIL